MTARSRRRRDGEPASAARQLLELLATYGVGAAVAQTQDAGVRRHFARLLAALVAVRDEEPGR